MTPKSNTEKKDKVEIDGWTLEVEIAWVECPPEREAYYSAVIEWYAREIQKRLNGGNELAKQKTNPEET